MFIHGRLAFTYHAANRLSCYHVLQLPALNINITTQYNAYELGIIELVSSVKTKLTTRCSSERCQYFELQDKGHRLELSRFQTELVYRVQHFVSLFSSSNVRKSSVSCYTCTYLSSDGSRTWQPFPLPLSSPFPFPLP